MILHPASATDLSASLAKVHAEGVKVSQVVLSSLGRVFEHVPEDMTTTVDAGITLAALQARLAERGQWLPIDPPNPEKVTVADLLNGDLSGPRRFGYGTIREHLLGLQVVLADGRIIRNGGKVVKNVAGYDLCKLFVGARGTLGIIVEATFKLRPLPEAEFLAAGRLEKPAQAGDMIASVLESDLTPVIFDLLRDRVILGFAGTREEVAWQQGTAAGLGFREDCNLDYEGLFWRTGAPPRRLSVLPSRLIEAMERLGPDEFVARAGNGVIYYRGGSEPPAAEVPVKLLRKIKDTYDPKHILPELSL